MDEVDLIIIKELWKNSRITIRDLCDTLGMSVNSVHKRINNLENEGIIEKFVFTPAKLHPASVWVLIIGQSDSPALEKAIYNLGNKGNITKAIVCLDNWVMIEGHLKDISDIKSFTEEVVRELAIEDYTFCIESCDEKTDEPVSLSKLDYQICYSLSENSRKSMSDVAEELGVSPKTVKRRLAKMEKDKAVYATIQWQPTMSNDIIAYLYLTLNHGVGKKEIIADLSNNYKPHFPEHYEFSNLPDFLLVAFWGKTLREINDIQHRLNRSGKFKKIVTNVQYKAYHFDTWAQEHVRKMAKVNE